MSTLSELIATVQAFGESISNLVKKKPAEALVSDDASLLSNVTKASLLAVVPPKVTTHANNVSNPHATTAAKLGGVDKAYVDTGLSAGVSLSVLPVSQYGDTTNASLGITTSGFVLTFTKAIQAYVLGTFKLFPIMTLNLANTDPSPANKTFYVYVTVSGGDLVYVVSQAKLPETLSLMYVGKVVTNGTSITAMTIGRVSRLGANRISTSPQGSAIPTTAGNPTAPAKLNAGWKP